MASERLTHSKRSSFLFCPRQFFWRYEQGLELRVQRRGRRRGRIFGDALQAARDASEWVQGGSDLMPIEQALASVDSSYVEAWTEDVQGQDDADTLEIERAKVRVMVAAYIERYGLAPRREVEYALSYRNPATGGFSKTWRIAGKMDGLSRTGPKHARLIEDKFVGQIQRPMIERLPLDAQTTEYVQALAAKGWTADIAFRHTRYPGVNPEKGKEYKTKPDKPPETLDEFEERLAEDIQARPDFYFDEQLIVFPTWHLEEFEQERWEVGQMIINAREREKVVGRAAFPKSPTRCWEFGGCPYIPLCCGREGAEDLYVKMAGDIELSEDESYGDSKG